MARNPRQNRYKKKTAISDSKDETIAKLDSLTSKTKNENKLIKASPKQINWTYAGLIIGILVVGGLIGLSALFNNGSSLLPGISNTGPNATNYLVCEHSDTGDHYHFILELYTNGVIHNLPTNVGSKPNCLRPIHTHDGTGELNKIHVELPPSITKHPSIAEVIVVYKDTYPSATLTSTELLSVQGNVTATVNNVNNTNILNYVP